MRSIGFDRPYLAKVFVALTVCTALTVAVSSAAPSHASAQCLGTAASPCITPVRPDGKGMIGLGLIGGEIGLIIPAIIQNAARTNEWWPYLVFPLIGIGAGIGGGYALEQATPNQAEIDVGIMIGAMVLIIPTIVGTLALASYSPPGESVDSDDDMTVDDTSHQGDSVEAVQDDGSPTTGTAPPPPSTPPPSSGTSSGTSLIGTTPRDAIAGGPGIVRFDTDGSRILLGIPMVGAIARYTSEELATLHIQQQYDVNIPLVSASF